MTIIDVMSYLHVDSVQNGHIGQSDFVSVSFQRYVERRSKFRRVIARENTSGVRGLELGNCKPSVKIRFFSSVINEIKIVAFCQNVICMFTGVILPVIVFTSVLTTNNRVIK